MNLPPVQEPLITITISKEHGKYDVNVTDIEMDASGRLSYEYWIYPKVPPGESLDEDIENALQKMIQERV